MFCQNCGNELADTAAICMKCGVPTTSHMTVTNYDIGQDATMRALLPVGRSGKAITAGYFGLMSLLMLPFCVTLFFIDKSQLQAISEFLWALLLLVLPAPLALLFGVMGVIDIKMDSRKHGMGRAIFGIACGLIFTIIGVALAIFMVLNSSVSPPN